MRGMCDNELGLKWKGDQHESREGKGRAEPAYPLDAFSHKWLDLCVGDGVGRHDWGIGVTTRQCRMRIETLGEERKRE